jgi:uncharacterized protein YjdB
VVGSGASATITSVATGSAQITATATPGNVSGFTTVTVTAELQSVAVNPSSVVLDFSANRTRQLTATATAHPGINVTYSWVSLDPTKVTAAPATGTTTTLTAVGAGTATVRVTGQSQFGQTRTADIAVTVNAVVRGVSISPPAATLDIGQSTTLTATVDADPGISREVDWSSSAQSVATVNANGTVTAVAPGNAVISAVSRANQLISGSANVLVQAVGRLVNLNRDTVSLTLSAQAQLTATVSGEPGFPLTVNWASRNTTIATVSATGIVTGGAQGQTYVVASATGDASVRDSALVIVTLAPNNQAVTQWSTIVAPNVSGGGARWFNTVYESAYTPTGLLLIAADCNIFGRSGNGFVASASPFFACPQFFQSTPTALYAFSYSGAIFNWTSAINFSVRNSVLVPAGFILSDAWVAPLGEAFAVGSSGGLGSVRRLFGGVWQVVTTPAVGLLRAIWGTSASDFIAAGESSTVLRCNLSACSLVAGLPAATTVYDVWSSGDGNYYFATSQGAWRLNGTTFTQLHALPTFLVDGTGPTDVWFAQRFVVDRWNGSTMQTDASRASFGRYNIGINSFAAHANEIGYGAAFALVSVLPRATGSQPTILALNPRFTDVAVTGTTHAVAVGDLGQVARFNGSNWTTEANFQNTILTRVASLGPTQTWATGDFGVYFSNGTSWSEVFTRTNRFELQGIWASSATDVWAVGAGGLIVRFNGSAWQVVSAGTFANLFAVTGTSPQNVFIGGDNGLILRWNGTAFQTMPSGTTQRVLQLRAGSGGVVYGLATGGTYLRFDGTSWGPLAPGVTSPAGNSFWVNSGTDLYSAAACIQRFNGNAWQQLDCNFPGMNGIDGLSTPGGAVGAGEQGRLWLGRNAQGGFNQVLGASQVAGRRPTDLRPASSVPEPRRSLPNDSATRATSPRPR